MPLLSAEMERIFHQGSIAVDILECPYGWLTAMAAPISGWHAYSCGPEVVSE